MGSVRRITDDLEKPETDDRSYRVIELPNKLEALLVHDPNTDKASASLTVNVGNFSDEEDMPGMAHAVEHLLFMGTEKYPIENAYASYLASNSGYSNAYTSTTHTNYYFECAAERESESQSNGTTNGIQANGTTRGPLHGALDRFAQFFIKPLFLESTLGRELNAVNSENKKNLQSDVWRLSQLVKSLSNPKHPYHHFSTGNLQTLKELPEKRGANIRNEFIRFYERHYSANRMKLVVLGRESLEELEDWVVDLFSQVKNKNLPENRWDSESALTEKELNTEIFAKPVMQTRSLEISFPWQDEEEMYETQPARFISHLIGHEGPGSILVYLKEQGLANTLSAGYHNVCPGTSLFEISIGLTPEGLTRYRDVVKIVFYYISMMRDQPPLEWMHEEMKNMGDVDFRFCQKTPASKFTSSTSAVMQKPIPRQWLLSNTSKYRRFDPGAIVNAMQFLRDDNFRLIVVSQDYPGDWNEKERWYGTDYRVQKIPVEVQEDFRKSLSAPAQNRPTELHLPHRNEFIPTRLEVEKTDIKEPAKTPKLLRNDDKMRLWWKKDDAFWVPKANVNVLLRNPLAYATPANHVKAGLFTDLVKDALTSYSYDAEISGLYYSVTANMLGIDIAVHGYNDKLPVLLEKILVTLRNLDIRPERFEIIKERMTRKYKNWDYQQPYSQVGDVARWLLNEKAWITHQYAVELPHVALEDVRAFAPQLIQQAHIEILAHGNLYKDEAKKIGNLVESTLHSRVLPSSQWQLRRSIILSRGSNYIFKQKLADAANVNHCIEYYLQVGHVMDQDVRSRLQLFAQISDEPCFDQLRTKEQLGYVVWSGVRPSATMMGYRVLIQSDRDPEYLETRINAFLLQMKKHLADMSEEDFEGHKRSLITKRLERMKNLGAETARLWAYINGEYFNFFQVDEDVAGIRSLTKKDVQQFFSTYMDPESPTRAKIAVHLVAQSQSTSEDIGPEEKRKQFVGMLGESLDSAGVEVDEAQLEKRFNSVDLSDKDAIINVTESYIGTSIPAQERDATVGQLEEVVSQLMLALKIKSPGAEANGIEVAAKVPAPVMVEDISKWKASLQLSEGALSMVELAEFEDLDHGPKL